MLEDSKAGKKQQDSGAGSCKTSPDWKNTSLVAQLEKNLPEMQETRVRFLGWEDPLEKEMAIHSSILAWRTPWTEEPGRLLRVPRVRHNSATTPPPPRLAFIDQMPKSAQNSSVFLINLPKHCFTCFSSVQSRSRCLTLCDSMDGSTPGFPVHHQLPEPAQTHVH